VGEKIFKKVIFKLMWRKNPKTKKEPKLLFVGAVSDDNLSIALNEKTSRVAYIFYLYFYEFYQNLR
jgi:hypothetical protein